MHTNPVWCVKAVEPKEDFILLLTFENGEQKLYDCKPILLEYPAFACLKNPTLFNKVYVEHHSVAWNDELDIAPEDLYERGIPV